jgi:hypothetical protein
VLTAEQAREIFLSGADLGFSTCHGLLAEKYRVSSKAIRDIWRGRSWLHTTFDLWKIEDRPALKKIGRPKGRKDSRPRIRVKSDSFSHDNLKGPSAHEMMRSSGQLNHIKYGYNSSPTPAHIFKIPDTTPPAQKDTPVLPSICAVLQGCKSSLILPPLASPHCPIA